MVVGEISEQVEVVVLGGGPGGYAAAFHAADLGKKVALVDQETRLGGVCLLRGCIPTKAMISAAELYHRVQHADRMGILIKDVQLDMKRLASWRDGIIDDLARGIEGLCKQRGIRRIIGRGHLTGPNELRVSGDSESTTLRFENAILAIGTRPVLPPPFKKNKRIVTTDEAFAIDTLPESLLIVGGGYNGVELGTCFAALGSKVTVVELLDRLLIGTDIELVRVVRKHMEDRGIAIHLESKVVEVQVVGEKVRVKVQPNTGDAWSGAFDYVLVAIGRKPNTDELGLDRAGVKTNDRGFINVDEQCRTSASHIFAIGDCTGPPLLAHRARRQGIVAAEVIAGKPSAFDNRTVPAVVFSDPEIAYCGLSEEDARKAGHEVKIARFRFAASGRAKTLDQTDGFITVVAEAGTEVVLGVRMVGPHVSELIGEATLAVETGAVLEDLIATIHVHPTLSESLMEAAEAVRGQALHAYRAPAAGKTRDAKTPAKAE